MSGRSQMAAMNGKRPSAIPARLQPEPPAQHDALIKYIYDSWNSVSRELDMCHQQRNNVHYRHGAFVTYYQEQTPNPQLKDQRWRYPLHWPGSMNSNQRNVNTSGFNTNVNSRHRDTTYYQGKNYQQYDYQGKNYQQYDYHKYHFNINDRYQAPVTATTSRTNPENKFL